MIVQKFDQETCNHKLVDTDTGEETKWTDYTRFIYLNGYVGYTAYYGVIEGVLTADNFCKMVASSKE